MKKQINEDEKNCWNCGNNVWKKGNPKGFKQGYCLIYKKWFSDTANLATKNCRNGKNGWISMKERFDRERN